MSKFWVIATHEYKRHVLQKRFIFSLLSIPMVLAFMLALIWIMVRVENKQDPVGIVDPGNRINLSIPIPESADISYPVTVIAFADERSAKAALENEEIQAFLLLPESYPMQTRAALYYYEAPGSNVYDTLRAVTRLNFLMDKDASFINRSLAGFDTIIRTPDGLKEFSKNKFLNIAVPIASSFMFMFMIILSSNYFSAIVSEEKDNRTMEILTTSVSSFQLIGGKIIGIIGVVATQVLSWVLLILLALKIAATQFNEPWLQEPSFDGVILLQLLAIVIPAYLMYVSLITMVGSMAGSVQEGQQISGLFVLPMSFSFMMLSVILESPNSPLSVGISMFPFTAPILMPLRSAFTVVPTEQIIGCIVLLIICAGLGVWLASKAYEIGQLRYGSKIKIRELFRKNFGRTA